MCVDDGKALEDEPNPLMVFVAVAGIFAVFAETKIVDFVLRKFEDEAWLITFRFSSLRMCGTNYLVDCE